MREQNKNTIRPTKKQRELLTFIAGFIDEHGYSPSYREIMSGCNYTSVATVALHVNSLIQRGHLRKRDRSARSLEVVPEPVAVTDTSTPEEEENLPAPQAWLLGKIEERFSAAEATEVVTPLHAKELEILVTALQLLGLETEAAPFTGRLEALSGAGAPQG